MKILAAGWADPHVLALMDTLQACAPTALIIDPRTSLRDGLESCGPDRAGFVYVLRDDLPYDDCRAAFRAGANSDSGSASGDAGDGGPATFGKGVIFFLAAEDAVARALDEGKAVDEALARWCAMARDLIAFHRHLRQHVLLTDAVAAHAAIHDFLTIAANRFGLNGPGEAIVPPPVSRPDDACRLVAEKIIAGDAVASRLNEALRAASPREINHQRPAPDPMAIMASVRAIPETRAALDAARAEADRAAHTIEKLTEELAQVRRERDDNARMAAEAREQVTIYDAQLEDADDQYANLLAHTRAIQDVAEAYYVQAGENAAQASEIARLTARLEKSEGALAGMQASFYWRAGAPLRKVTGGLRRSTGLKTRRHIDLVRKSPLFNAEWYLQTYADVRESGVDPAEHFVLFGGFEGRDPGPSFSSARYLKDNPDVAAARANPLVHFLRFGSKEGRSAGGGQS